MPTCSNSHLYSIILMKTRLISNSLKLEVALEALKTLEALESVCTSVLFLLHTKLYRWHICGRSCGGFSSRRRLSYNHANHAYVHYIRLGCTTLNIIKLQDMTRQDKHTILYKFIHKRLHCVQLRQQALEIAGMQ